MSGLVTRGIRKPRVATFDQSHTPERQGKLSRERRGEMRKERKGKEEERGREKKDGQKNF